MGYEVDILHTPLRNYKSFLLHFVYKPLHINQNIRWYNSVYNNIMSFMHSEYAIQHCEMCAGTKHNNINSNDNKWKW